MPQIVVITVCAVAAILGAPFWIAFLCAGLLVAETYRQLHVDAVAFAQKHPGHVLSLEPSRPIALALMMSGGAFALGMASRLAAMQII